MHNKEQFDICMLVTNAVTQDPRVRKEAETLSDAGYSLVVLGMKTTFEDALEEILEPGYRVVRADVSKPNTKIKKWISHMTSMGSTRGMTKMLIVMLKVLLKLIQSICFLYKASSVRAKVYHAHDLDTLPAAYLASLRFGGKLVYDSHELYTEQREDFPRLVKAFLQKIEGFLVKRTKKTITVNDSIARELSKRYSIPRPISLRNFMRKTIADKPLDSKEDSNTNKVLYHGGYMAGRGLEELITSVQYWDMKCNLYLRGFGPSEEQLKQLVSNLELENRVFFLEPVSMKQLVQEASSFDIGIIPYKPTCLNNLYSMPNKLFEYMMAGLAIGASDLPEISRLNQEISFGMLFDPESPKSIAEAVNHLASDPQLLQRYRENSWEWSRRSGNWETESQKLIELYEKLLGETYEEKTVDRQSI